MTMGALRIRGQGAFTFALLFLEIGLHVANLLLKSFHGSSYAATRHLVRRFRRSVSLWGPVRCLFLEAFDGFANTAALFTTCGAGRCLVPRFAE